MSSRDYSLYRSVHPFIGISIASFGAMDLTDAMLTLRKVIYLPEYSYDQHFMAPKMQSLYNNVI
jgi:hypothetical protein